MKSNILEQKGHKNNARDLSNLKQNNKKTTILVLTQKQIEIHWLKSIYKSNTKQGLYQDDNNDDEIDANVWLLFHSIQIMTVTKKKEEIETSNFPSMSNLVG